MDPITLATLIATGAAKAVGFALDAIAAARAGNEAKALEHIDGALAELGGVVATLQTKLDALKTEMLAKLEAKLAAAQASER